MLPFGLSKSFPTHTSHRRSLLFIFPYSRYAQQIKTRLTTSRFEAWNEENAVASFRPRLLLRLISVFFAKNYSSNRYSFESTVIGRINPGIRMNQHD
nr:hypothetical protein [Tanacetum cinerariifolium]